MTDWKVLAMIALIIGAIGTGVYLGQKELAERAAEAAGFYSQCEYLGNRITGFGSHRVYRYDCDGIIEETRRDPR